MKDNFEKLCNITSISSLQKIEAALNFIWYHQRVCEYSEIDIKTINGYFVKADLAEFPYSRLKEQLTRNSKVTKGTQQGTYKLNRKALEELDKKYLSYFKKVEISIKEKANLSEAPFLNPIDVENAHKMAELYIIAHCYENSVRRFIENILVKEIGANWWDFVKNKDLIDKYTSRKKKEDKEKWVSSRGDGTPLFYLDWPDLVKIIRKEENHFIPYVNDIKWVEMRFEELESVRNVIAHNGLVESDDMDRIVLYFKDWCKQIKTP